MIESRVIGYGLGSQRCEKPASIAGAEVLSVCDSELLVRATKFPA